MIDGFPLSIAYNILFWLSLSNLDFSVFFATYALAFITYFGVVPGILSGQTLGKRVTHVRVIRMDGGALTVPRGILRAAVLFVGSFFAIVPLSIALSPDGRGLHDRIANTRVVLAAEPQAS